MGKHKHNGHADGPKDSYGQEQSHHEHHLGHHGHHHGHHGHHHHVDLEGNKKGLIIALAITFGIMLLEFFGGLFTGSLALLSDSGHMLSDSSSLVLSLIAVWIAAKPASPKKTYGYQRFEIVAALFNGISLFIIAGFIVWEAIERFANPPAVSSGSMMVIALIGLLANLLSAYFLMSRGDVKNNINLRSAYLHILGDALGSIGAIGAGLVMWLFGWYIADPVISMAVSLLILRGAWSVFVNALHILMEGTPEAIDQQSVRAALEQIDGVLNVHDLHIWTITSGMDSLSCHLLVDDNRDSQRILQQAIRLIGERFGIHHTTIQVENSGIEHEGLHQ
ncbi:cation diffusion facilitator family transporter [Paenibacillus tarimensis]|uniref:cation diffusion facilitator family transporter n=1 Tax=Paenibacillus tarimensis TaxID=416012 RepID=UPI001F16F62E|nr:cation diffusion facilitator family transporter [Paenibacillus tarimensis]MCF2943715.1 cation diffusion facilitator family transporter [Paenibacillus tarimensis]